MKNFYLNYLGEPESESDFEKRKEYNSEIAGSVYDNIMKQYLIETYFFSQKVAEEIANEYELLLLKTDSNLSIDEFVKSHSRFHCIPSHRRK